MDAKIERRMSLQKFQESRCDRYRVTGYLWRAVGLLMLLPTFNDALI